MLKVLIADDYEIVRRGIKEILKEGYPSALIEEASDYSSLLSKLTNADWNIILSDVAIFRGPGFQTIQELIKKIPGSPVLVLGIDADEQYFLSLLKAGAAGFLNKDVTPTELVKAVNQVLSGKKYFPGLMIEKIV
jgi:DNA-binding NarL/FixJ family response regulator